ncbi:MAG TPA: DUF4416 family protein [Thermodesulfovibrionales bacterium]|nr:DUF4416 family protein [Thermodesulfovibrionales bacterium]
MGKPSLPEETLLFTGALYRKKEYIVLARKKLEELFGEVILETAPMPWDYSSYYEDELGRPMERVFFFFRDRIDPLSLAGIKLATNDTEQQLSTEGKRNINLDPGYITPSKVVLASTKNYSHRIYIGKGIFAEVTLVYKDGKYRPHLFTYRDYASDEYAEIFQKARKLLQPA